MTKDEINRRIAECVGADKFVGLKKRGLWYRANACGYTSCECEAGRYTLEEAKQHEYTPPGYPEEHVTIHRFTPPNYHDSLDAMHAAIQSQRWDAAQEEEFRIELLNVFARSKTGFRDSAQVICNATAAHYAEAFLRKAGKWEGAGV